MSDMVLTCKSRKLSELVEIMSPGVGRVSLRVHIGQAIVGSQVIGDFYCLNQHHVLRAADDCFGTVAKLKDHDRFINLSFGEIFLVLRPTVADGLCGSSTLVNGGVLDHVKSIDAPMDGMFYLSSSPESPPFVAVGDTVSPGQTIGLIEVMKCFYPVKYQGDKAVKIRGVSIKNATPVNCGTQIYTIND